MRTVSTLLIAVAMATPSKAAGPSLPELAASFDQTVRPFLDTFCSECHGAAKQEAKFDLSSFNSLAAVRADLGHWELVLTRLKVGEMPPEEALQQPTEAQRQAVVRWIETVREFEATRNAGDPGPVLPRRLSNAEFDYTIRDLTGVDIRPTREFPVDPTNRAGFANSGESLSMTPALFSKYLAASRHVADHLVLLPSGFTFAPHPAVIYSDRDKFAVRRIVDFYAQQNTDYADYLLAAWRLKHRSVLGEPGMTSTSAAASLGVSEKYLLILRELLEDGQNHAGPIAELRDMWCALPVPLDKFAAPPRAECEAIRKWIIDERSKREFTFPSVLIERLNPTSQPSVLWKNRLIAERRRQALLTDDEQADQALRSAVARFCEVFPDKFVLTERGRMNLPFEEQNKGRLLGAGFHLQVGYYRDDAPLYDMLLNDSQRAQLDTMWRELFFVTDVHVRQFQDFIYFERAENPRILTEAQFDFARGEDRAVASRQSMDKIAELFCAAVEKRGLSAEAVAEVRKYFVDMSQNIRDVEHARLQAQPVHLDALVNFAERAWRRPLTETERSDLLASYRDVREQTGVEHEDAIRDVVAMVLASPYFCYRIDVAETANGPQNPVTDYTLASRLSYFLWSSMPDEELMRVAETGDLGKHDVLLNQVHRMLRDERARALAVEFGGNWLGFRQFQQHVGVDRTKFAQFTDELRDSMFQEPIRFVADLIQRDGSVRELLEAEHTFVDQALAKHYHIPYSTALADDDGWMRVDDATSYGRGGILAMSAFLTKHSPGLRTSPVKRGYWIVKEVLGEHIPAPPSNVPAIPQDESDLGDLTVRALMERHRADKGCAACHDRFDFAGLVFEGYGPIGERRVRDLGGKDIDESTVFPNGTSGRGLNSIREYLARHRHEQFDDNLCRKLLAYALGRTLLLSDEPTITQMKQSLARHDHRFSSLVEVIVTSSQFLHKRTDRPPTPE